MALTVEDVESKRCRHMEQRYCCVVCNMKQHLELRDIASFDIKYQKCWLTFVKCEGGEK